MTLEIKDNITKSQKLIYAGSVYLGYYTADVDGFWYWNSPVGSGTYSSYHLNLVSEKLDELNDEWEGIIKRKMK